MRIPARGPATVRTSHPPAAAEHPVATAGRLLVRYGLVVVIAWVGALKYTGYEASAIQPLIAHSPLLSWLYHVVSGRALAAALGTAEIAAALLIAARPVWPRVSAAGSAFGVLLFASTLSFLVTTPGVTAAPAGGFPVLSVLPGQFLLKDIVLIGAALWTLGDSLGAARPQARPPGRSACRRGLPAAPGATGPSMHDRTGRSRLTEANVAGEPPRSPATSPPKYQVVSHDVDPPARSPSWMGARRTRNVALT